MNKTILNTLGGAKVPVAYQEYRGSESEYIRFFYLPKTFFYASDDEIYATYHIQIDVFSPGDPNEIASNVKQSMKEAGFKKSHEHEDYEEDEKVFHYILRFYITEEEQ